MFGIDIYSFDKIVKVNTMYKDELKNEYLVFHESVMNFIKECD